MTFFYLWVCSVIVTPIIASYRKLSVAGYLIMSIFLGPVALLVVALVSPGRPESVRKTLSLQEIKSYLVRLERSMAFLQEEIKKVQGAVRALEGEAGGEPVEAVKEQQPLPPVEQQENETHEAPVPQPQPAPEVPQPAVQSRDMEVDFARNWLNKIGVIIFSLGIAFLISYTFKYFTPFIKIMFGYLTAGLLFVLGANLQKQEKMRNYAHVLLGGGWAVTYFTTYAMYHFEAARLIHSQVVDLYLLGLVVGGMILHAVRNKSESMTSLALFVAYLTAVMGGVSQFTFVSCALLAVAILILVYKFHWTNLLVLGVFATYASHLFLRVTGAFYDAHLSLAFLSGYCLVFFLGVHLVRMFEEAEENNSLAAINFFNFILYFLIGYPLFSRLYFPKRYGLLLGVGAVYLIAAVYMKIAKQKKMYVSDLVISIFALTFMSHLKFVPTTALMVWLIEVPFLLFVGLALKEKLLRFISYVLTVVVCFRFVLLAVFGNMASINFLGITWLWEEFIALWAALSMGVSCFFLRRNISQERNPADVLFDYLFSTLSFVFVAALLWSKLPQVWESFGLSIMAALMFIAYDVFSFKRLRYYCYALLALIGLKYMFISFAHVTDWMKWMIIFVHNAVFFTIYFYTKDILRRTKEAALVNESQIVFIASMAVVLVTIFRFAAAPWLSLVCGLTGLVLVLCGLAIRDRLFRASGFVLFVMALVRIFLVDLATLDIIYKIISFMILGGVFLGISYLYTRLNMDEERNRP